MLENPWSAVGNPTSALSPLGSSFGPSSLTPVGIHHLLLSNLTTVLASSWGSLGAGRGMAALSVVCREKQKERQREEMWKKLNQFAEKHKSNMQRKTRWAEVSVGQTVTALFHYAVAADVPFDFIRCDRLYFLYVSDKLLMWWTDGWSSLLQRFSHAAAGRTCVLLVCLFVTPFRHTHLCVSCMVLLTAWYQEPLWWYKYGCHFYIQFFVSAVFPSSVIWQIWPTLFTLFFVFCFFQRPVNSLLTVMLPLLYVACCGIYCSWSVLELVIVPTA